MDNTLPPDNNQPSTPTNPNETPTEPAKKGYGKKPAWFWILVYLVVGGLAYFLIYKFFLADTPSGTLY